MLVGAVAVIIVVVVIILLDVSSPATLGTAQTLAHNNAVFTGRQRAVGLGLPASSRAARGPRRALLLQSCYGLTLSPSLGKVAPKQSLDLEEQPEVKTHKTMENRADTVARGARH